MYGFYAFTCIVSKYWLKYGVSSYVPGLTVELFVKDSGLLEYETVSLGD
jgi:hypothetical protein